ncbi:peptide/nickel transport system ATP-binding protein [Pseudorhodobacter antarcticus]|uniref:Peptide/nickel transport system ATP-binding protein n=1 Tax=Pseudorhodobacter antarcticus TaxID=1077947 RepID=A0A1H8K9F9_9RHOB|nr:ABC transporter ATP-binding protein [Pseudorhodobacter antarcticus]SEN89652.1 peptide/nickel transport system ATP-binding protein [Pseudorhodobacter antarcticus]
MSFASEPTVGAALAPTPDPVLRVDGLCVSVRTDAGLKPLVSDLSFALNRGETLAIAGESGSGKSITSLAIMGLLPPPAVHISGGSIHLGAVGLHDLPEHQMRAIRGDRIAMIFQEPMTSLNPVLTVGFQLAEAIRAHQDVSRATARTRAIEALQAVRLSEPARRFDQYPHELSGGMRQRVMIAMALALRPEVLIADEPTTALDVTVQREVLDLLRDLQCDLGTAIILITHDMGVVAEMADRVIVMQNGRMVEQAATRDLFARPTERYTRDLLAAVPRMGQGAARHAPVPAALVASLRDVSVRFGLKGGLLGRTVRNVHAVEAVSFDIRRAETFALVGESGCGKSTIAKAMMGLVDHAGSIAIGDTSLKGLDKQGLKNIRRRVQMVFQDPMAALNPRMRVGDLIAEPLVIHRIGTRETQCARAADLMARVGLTADQYDRYPHEFSGGQRQRICIARALCLNPELIIADESVSALDVSVQARVLDLLATLQREFGVAYLFISHDMAVVENICDRVAVMYLGQIVEMGTKAQVFGNSQHPYTRRLIDAVPVPDPAFVRQPQPRLAGDVPSPVFAIGAGPVRVALTDIGGGHLVAQGSGD